MSLVLADGMANAAVRNFASSLFAFNGSTWDRLRVPSARKFHTATAIGASIDLWAAVALKKIRLLGMWFSVSAGVSFSIKETTGGVQVYQTPLLTADTAYYISFANGILHSTLNTSFKILGSGAANLIGTVEGCEEG